jgi:hypothetical protein
MEIPGVNRGGLDPTMGRGLRAGEGAGIAATGWISGRELRDFASEQRRIALDELRAFGDALVRHRQARERLEADLAHAWTDLLTSSCPPPTRRRRSGPVRGWGCRRSSGGRWPG